MHPETEMPPIENSDPVIADRSLTPEDIRMQQVATLALYDALYPPGL